LQKSNSIKKGSTTNIIGEDAEKYYLFGIEGDGLNFKGWWEKD